MPIPPIRLRDLPALNEPEIEEDPALVELQRRMEHRLALEAAVEKTPRPSDEDWIATIFINTDRLVHPELWNEALQSYQTRFPRRQFELRPMSEAVFAQSPVAKSADDERRFRGQGYFSDIDFGGFGRGRASRPVYTDVCALAAQSQFHVLASLMHAVPQPDEERTRLLKRIGGIDGNHVAPLIERDGVLLSFQPRPADSVLTAARIRAYPAALVVLTNELSLRALHQCRHAQIYAGDCGGTIDPCKRWPLATASGGFRR